MIYIYIIFLKYHIDDGITLTLVNEEDQRQSHRQLHAKYEPLIFLFKKVVCQIGKSDEQIDRQMDMDPPPKKIFLRVILIVI